MEPGLIEQGEIYSMQCCESHGKGARKSASKKAKYHAGVAVRNHVAGLCQAKCSYSEIHKTLKAEEILISLSVIKRIGQCFKTTGNFARKKGSGRPKASSCRDDHLLKFSSSQRQEKKPYKNCQKNSRPQKTRLFQEQ